MKKKYNKRSTQPDDYESWNKLTCYWESGGYVSESYHGLQNENHPNPIVEFSAWAGGSSWGNCTNGTEGCEKGDWRYYGKYNTGVDKVSTPTGMCFLWVRDPQESYDHENGSFTLSGGSDPKGEVECQPVGDCDNCSGN